MALFIKLTPEASEVDMEKLEKNIRTVIKTRLTNRHVPAYIRHVFWIVVYTLLFIGIGKPAV